MAVTWDVAEGERRSARFLLAAVALLTAAPLFAVRFLPFTDLPEHVAAIATLARMLPGGGGAPEYVVSFRESQYLLYHACGAVLARGVGDAILANRLLLAAVAIAWPYGMRALARALGRDERIAIFACVLFWNRALVVGFLPFLASVPIALFALASAVRVIDSPDRRRAALLGLLAVVLFYAHVSAYVLFVITAGVLAVVSGLAKEEPRREIVRALLRLVPLLPSTICALFWWSSRSLETGTGETSNVGRLPLERVVNAAPLWAFDIWRSHGDEVCSALWSLAFALVLLVGFRREPGDAKLAAMARPVVPFACALLVYLVTPFRVGPAGYLDVRLAPVLALLALLFLAPAGGTIGRIQLALPALALLGATSTAVFEMRRIERETIGDFDAVLAEMRPGSRVALLNLEFTSPRSYFAPYPFAGSYHRRKPGTVSSYSFTDLPHWSVHPASAAEPPRRTPFWAYHPCSYRYRLDGEWYDYVLVQGRAHPFAFDHPGPRFERRARSGAFTLYAKTGAGDGAPGDEDRSPCVPVHGPPSP